MMFYGLYILGKKCQMRKFILLLRQYRNRGVASTKFALYIAQLKLLTANLRIFLGGPGVGAQAEHDREGEGRQVGDVRGTQQGGQHRVTQQVHNVPRRQDDRRSVLPKYGKHSSRAGTTFIS